MRILRVVLHLLVFLAIGEGLVRFDRMTAFFRSGEHLVNEPKASALLTSLAKGTFTPSGDELRVMVVGDSFLFGAGVPADEVFAVQLAADLKHQQSKGHSRVTVLDLTRPGNNTYANRLDFEKYSEAFDPDVVVLAYNANDVYGDQGVVPSVPIPSGGKTSRTSGDAGLDLVASIRRVVYKSQLLEFALQNVNMELKLAGVVIPGSEFEHQVNRSHTSAFGGWANSQRHLQDIADQVQHHHGKLIVVNVPELNMLGNYKVFHRLNSTIEQFFRGLGVDYMELSEWFLKEAGETYSVSRYDGHPNGVAHRLIARVVAARILDDRAGWTRDSESTARSAASGAGNR